MNYGPCMCGDLCCPSCGPAQGNHKCPICGEWVTEGCPHIDERDGQLKDEFLPQANRHVEPDEDPTMEEAPLTLEDLKDAFPPDFMEPEGGDPAMDEILRHDHIW